LLSDCSDYVKKAAKYIGKPFILCTPFMPQHLSNILL